MAMEKLILRSVLYGADKIPDKWFEKVPGGFFREKDGNKRGAGSGRDRRYSTANDERRYRNEDEDDYDDGYRSEGHRQRHQRSRSSFDGGADEDDDYYLSGDERRRRRSGKSHRRRRSLDDDRRGYDEGRRRGHHGEQRDPYDGDRRSHRQPPRPPDPYYDRERPSTGGSDRSANPFSRGAYPPAGNPAYSRGSMSQSPPIQSPGFAPAPEPRSGSVGNGYVPYANIYGQQSPRQAKQPFSPPPTSSFHSPRPDVGNRGSPPVAPPPQGYQQNPFAQEAPTAADAGAGAAYTGEPGLVDPPLDPRWVKGPDPYYSARLYTGYDENNPPYPDSTSPRRSSRREYSPSRDSYDSRTQDRRSRSERRNDNKSNSKGKSKSGVREAFDSSQRGLGYGAVGAVTGGLLGSEFGKGIMPKVIGATVGALGANAFEAREKYVHPRPSQHAQMPTQPPPPTMNRRKEGRRNSEYPRQHERRDSRRGKDEGYYSD